MAARTLLQMGVRHLGRLLVVGPMMTCTGVRHFNVPDRRTLAGGLLLVSNHQSFFDPPLVGMALPVPISYLARRTLFDVPGFGRLISAVSAFPVDRETADAAALRTVMRVLRSGESLLLFPEGTRTRDGRLGLFKPGAAAIAIRCGVPVLPVCIEGAYRCWPRTRALPRPARVAVAYGEPVAPHGRTPDEMMKTIRSDIERMRVRLRRYMGRTAG